MKEFGVSEFPIVDVESMFGNGMPMQMKRILAADNRERKPSADPLSLAVEKAGGELRRTIMVGDSKADAECAQAAGVPCVLVDYGYTAIPVSELVSLAVAV